MKTHLLHIYAKLGVADRAAAVAAAFSLGLLTPARPESPLPVAGVSLCQMSAMPVTVFGPDFPFAYDEWLRHPAGLGAIPESSRGATVAIVGAGLAGMVAAYELMELELRPVVYERARIGGRALANTASFTPDLPPARTTGPDPADGPCAASRREPRPGSVAAASVAVSVGPPACRRPAVADLRTCGCSRAVR